MNKEFAAYLCEDWNSISYFCVSYASVLRVVVDLLAEKHPDIFDHARIRTSQSGTPTPLAEIMPNNHGDGALVAFNPRFIWGDNLDIHFIPQEGFTQLKINNEEERRVGAFFQALTTGLLDFVIEKLFSDDPGKIESSPFAFLNAFARQLKRTPQLNKTIRNVSVRLPKTPRKIIDGYAPEVDHQGDLCTLSFAGLNFRHGTKNTQAVHRTCRRVFTLFLAHFEEWYKDHFGQEDVFYPSLPGVKPYQPALQMGLVSELTYSKNMQSDHTGFFCIVREARGSITNRGRDMNLLVRDLLWIRPGRVESNSFAFDETAHQLPHQDGNSAEDHGSRIGYYYSAIDGLVYEIKRVVVRANIMMIDGLAILAKDKEKNIDRPPKSMCLYLPLIDNEDMAFTMGTLIGGTATNTRTGGWSVVAIRPPLESLEFGLERLLEKKFCIYADSLARMRRVGYDALIERFAEFIEQTGLVGILHSRSLVSAALGDAKSAYAEAAVSAFRHLFKIMPDYRDNCQSMLDEIEQLVFDGDTPDREGFREVITNLIEQQNSYAIAPLSVYKAALKDYDEAGTKAAVSVLSNMEVPFSSYREYQSQINGTS